MKPELKSMKSELRLSAGVCSLCWQGDFGKGVSTGSGVWSDPGANPCLLYGPVNASGGSGGVPQPQWKLGMVVCGDSGAEFVFCQLALTGTSDLLPGQVYQWDENYSLTLLQTSTAVLNAEIGVLNVWAPQQAPGTYYAWVQRCGHAAVEAASGSQQYGELETTGTAGQVKFEPSASHTSGTKSTPDCAAFQAQGSGPSFTGATVQGSSYVTNVVSGNAKGGVADLTLGMAFSMTGFTNAIIAGIDKVGGQWRILVGTNTPGSYSTVQNASASGTSVAATVTSHVIANVKRPALNAQH